MTLPTVTTVSKIGINLAQFRNSGQQPLLTCDTLNSSCFPQTSPCPQCYPFPVAISMSCKKILLSGRKMAHLSRLLGTLCIISEAAPLVLD